MDESHQPDKPNIPNIFYEGISASGSNQPSSSTKPGLVREVCHKWLIHEDGALAHQLQDQEIAAHYGHNREKNRMVRQDTPHARKEQEVELKQALALQKLEQELRAKQEKEDEEAARKLAEELEKEELRNAHCALQNDMHIAKSFQEMDLTESRVPREINKQLDCRIEKKSYKLSSPTRAMDLNQPMSEEEARQWQELCDAEMAKKLQEEEEEESKFRRDVRDLSKKLAIEARDRELALMLQEKEKARLRKAKEKARIKAQQKISNAAEGEQHKPNKANHHDIRDNVSQYPPPAENIALSIDPTWNMRQRHQELPHRSQNSIPITDLDFPAPVQPIVGGHRRSIYPLSNSLSSSPTPELEKTDSKKSGKSTCSHQ